MQIPGNGSLTADRANTDGAVAHRIGRLLTPTSVAVVGASDGSVWATGFVDNIRNTGFLGNVWMVNPHRTEAYGQKCYPTIADVPDQVDHALIVVRAELVPAVLRDCARAGVHSATVIASGFSEAGTTGQMLADEVLALSRAHDIDVIGPNCFGFMNFATNAALTRNNIERDLDPDGNVSLVFQSGQVNLSAYGSSLQRGVGLRYLVSSGNQLVTDTNDYFEYFLEDPGTKVLGGAIERLPDPRRFARIALAALKAEKPIVLCKLGVSEAGRRVALSHTGSVAGDRARVDAFLDDLGVVRVSTIDELIETAGILAQSGWPKGGRTLFLGGSGGACGVFADLAENTAIELPELSPRVQELISQATGMTSVSNPVDLTPSGFGVTATLVPGVFETGEFDVIVAQGEEVRSREHIGEEVAKGMEEQRSAVDRVFDRGGWAAFSAVHDRAPTEYGLAVAKPLRARFAHGPAGVVAIGKAIWYGINRQECIRHASAIVAAQRAPLDSRTELDRVSVSEQESKAVLSARGLQVTQDLTADSAEAAARAASRIGFPVVLKIDSPHIQHKSEIGGVVTNLSSEEEVRRAYGEILERASTAHPQHTFESVLVCEQVVGAHEVIVGGLSDPSVGKMLLVGAGGIYVEVFKDVALAVPPVDARRAEKMLRSLRVWPVLEGARGQTGADIATLVSVIVSASELLADDDAILELDINPVFATHTRAVVGDAFIVRRSQAKEEST